MIQSLSIPIGNLLHENTMNTWGKRKIRGIPLLVK
jgi:hypothetical protein